MSWRNEGALFEYLRPSLRGTWTRLEARYAAGASDSFGLWQGQTWWLELKLGVPSIDLLEGSQIAFGLDCLRHKVPWWVCFGHGGRAVFFNTPRLTRPRQPPFRVPQKRV